MARPAQYSRGRRVVMQVTLLAVLLATVGLAALLAQNRARAMSVTLTDEPLVWGRLALRYPVGWQVHPPPDDAPVTVLEPKRPGARDQRAIVVRQVPAESLTSEQLFQRQVDAEGELGPLTELNVLGQRGVMAR